MRHAAPRVDLHTNCAQQNAEPFGLIKYDQDPSLLREGCRGLTPKIQALPFSCIAGNRLCDLRNLSAQLRCLTLTAPRNTLCTHWLQPHRPQSPLTSWFAHQQRTDKRPVARSTALTQIPIQHCDVVLQQFQFGPWIAALSRHRFQILTLP